MATRKGARTTTQVVLRRAQRVVANVDTALVTKRIIEAVEGYADDLSSEELLDKDVFQEVYVDLTGAIEVVAVDV